MELTAGSAPVVLALGALGLCIGSFLNVVIWRIPQGLSVSQPPSYCPQCERRIRARHNVPVLSWVLLRARCASCGVRIPLRYPLVEVGCGALFAVVAATRHGWELAPYSVAAAGMLALSVIDLDHRRLPDRVQGPTSALCLGAFAIAVIFGGAPGSQLARAGLGAAIGFGSLGLVHLIQPAGMGFGDVKLAGLCGLILGWRGLGYLPVGLFGAFLTGAVVGVAVLVLGSAGRKTAIPFGPFLCGSALAVALVGDPVVNALGDALLHR